MLCVSRQQQSDKPASGTRSCNLFLLKLFSVALIGGHASTAFAEPSAQVVHEKRVALGKSIFQDTSLSRDHGTSCQSCHDPSLAYADHKALSGGTDSRVGTRNAPSLIGIGNDATYFWDGRRSRLEDAVLDPFTNPVELGLDSREELLARLNDSSMRKKQFREAFPNSQSISSDELAGALAAFIRSLDAKDTAPHASDPKTNAYEAQQGRKIFEGVGGCNECHKIEGTLARSDDQFHHSGVQQLDAEHLAQHTKDVIAANFDASALGPKILTDSAWSSLGRFVVSHQPADIGAFRTPSLRNVALTYPYMHDGSIATLAQAVDHEVYYRGLSQGHPIELSFAERQSLVRFLETLTDP